MWPLDSITFLIVDFLYHGCGANAYTTPLVVE